MKHSSNMSSEARRTEWEGIPLTSVCNDSKWENLRKAICALETRPRFRTMDLNGHYATADGEWEYHFRLGGYETTRYVDILCRDDEQGRQVLSILRANSLGGRAIEGGYRVYGYQQPGDEIAKF